MGYLKNIRKKIEKLEDKTAKNYEEFLRIENEIKYLRNQL